MPDVSETTISYAELSVSYRLNATGNFEPVQTYEKCIAAMQNLGLSFRHCTAYIQQLLISCCHTSPPSDLNIRSAVPLWKVIAPIRCFIIHHFETGPHGPVFFCPMPEVTKRFLNLIVKKDPFTPTTPQQLHQEPQTHNRQNVAGLKGRLMSRKMPLQSTQNALLNNQPPVA